MAAAIKALFFDVFGTLVDWRGSIAREAEASLKPCGTTLDWPAFADAWRGEYQGAMEEVRSGRIAFCTTVGFGGPPDIAPAGIFSGLDIYRP